MKLLIALTLVTFIATAYSLPAPCTAEPVTRHNWWQPRHQSKLIEVQTRGDKADIVFIGDSITHAWEHAFRWKDGREVWEKEYLNKFGAINLGYSGDRTENVLWRLQNGELANLKPKLFIVLIGTNNISKQHKPKEIVEGIQLIIKTLNSHSPKSKILLLGILPRETAKGQTQLKIQAGITEINNALEKLPSNNESLTYLDLKPVFCTPKGELQKKELMPDGLHPNLKGYKAWHKFMEPTIRKLLSP